MGIQGLLPLLKSISDPVHVSAYAGHRVGIDAYSWLHRGGHQCATELALHLPTDRHLQFCIARIRLLLSHNVRPVLVFDGGRLSSKRLTEEGRAGRRRKERELGRGLWDAGQKGAAFKAFQKCVSIHPGMAYQLIQLCKGMEGVEWVVAPYEADAELAYLSLTNFVSAVISEDSDLLVFGCRRVLYKMDAGGHGLEIKLNNLGACTELSLQHWSHAQFQQMCVLAGCDYLPSLPSLGLKKAHSMMRAAKSWDRAIRRLRLEGRISVYAGYEEDFQCALLCFQHQRVWDPIQRRLTFLTELSEEVKAAFPDLSFLGPEMNDDIAARIAEGELHPETLREFGAEDMEGLRPKEVGALRRTHSDGEVVSADADVGRVAPLPPSMALVLRAKSKVEGISALLVKNKIDGYFVGASEASRSSFVRPRSIKEADPPSSDPRKSQVKMARSASVSAVEMHSEATEVESANPFAAFAYKRKAAAVDEVAVEGGAAPATSADAEVEEKAVERLWTAVNDELEDNNDDEDWEDRYEHDGPDAGDAQMLTQAFSLPLRSLTSPSLHDSSLLLPPDLSAHALTSHSEVGSTFADSPLVDCSSSPSTSPSPPDLPPAASPVLDDPSRSPSPSPSPPPIVTGPIFSKYFSSSFSSSAPSASALASSPILSHSPPPPSSSTCPPPPPPLSTTAPAPPTRLPSFLDRDELLISDDDVDVVDDVQAADSGSDKENVDRNAAVPPSSQPSRLQSSPVLADDDIEDVPSPPFRPTPSPPPFFPAKRSARSLSPPPAITPAINRKRGGPRPLAFPLSAPTSSTGTQARAGDVEEKRRRVEGTAGDGGEGRGVSGGAGVGVSFFDQFKYAGGSPGRPAAAPQALPPPPLSSYARTARQLRR